MVAQGRSVPHVAREQFPDWGKMDAYERYLIVKGLGQVARRRRPRPYKRDRTRNRPGAEPLPGPGRTCKIRVRTQNRNGRYGKPRPNNRAKMTNARPPAATHPTLLVIGGSAADGADDHQGSAAASSPALAA